MNWNFDSYHRYTAKNPIKSYQSTTKQPEDIDNPNPIYTIILEERKVSLHSD
jgi:hypothetical protein